MIIFELQINLKSYSFNRNDLSIAALLISIYPHFPTSPNDNKYHLQALRHFYILAIEKKEIHAIDVDTKQAVNIDVQLKFEINDKQEFEELITPILLQDAKKPLEIRIKDSHYYYQFIKFDKRQVQNQLNRIIYVQKKQQKSIDHQSSQEKIIQLLTRKKQETKQLIQFLMKKEILDKSQNQNFIQNLQIFENSIEQDENNINTFNQIHTFNDIYNTLIDEDRYDQFEIYVHLQKKFDSFEQIVKLIFKIKGQNVSDESLVIVTFLSIKFSKIKYVINKYIQQFLYINYYFYSKKLILQQIIEYFCLFNILLQIDFF